MSSPYCISLADVEGAQSSLHGLIHLTLILTSSSLDKLASHRLFKCELFQKTVSFKDLVDDVLTVTEEEIQQATQLVWERIKLLIEPTAGVGVAAVLSEQFRSVSQEVKNLCIVLCEGNIALRSLAWLSPPGKEANGN